MKAVSALTNNTSNQNRRLIGDGIWLFGGRIASSAFLLGFTAIAARSLSVDALGQYVLAFNTSLVIAYIFALGLDQASVRYIAEHLRLGAHDQAAAHCRLVALMLLGWLPICWIAMAYGLLPVLGLLVPTLHNIPAMSALIATWGMLLGLRLVIAGILRGAHDARSSTIVDGLGAQSFAFVALGIGVLLHIEIDTAETIKLQMAGNSLFAAFGFLIIWMTFRHRTAAGKDVSLRRIANTAIPLMLTGLLSVAGTQILLMLVATLGAPSDVAHLGVALQVGNAIYLLFIVTHLIAGPVIASARASGDPGGLELATRSLATLVALPTVLVCTVIISCASYLLTLGFGASYAAATGPVVIFAIGRALEISFGLGQTVLMMGGRERLCAIIRLLGVLALPLLGWPAYKLFGINGVCALASLTWVVQAAIATLLVRKLFGYWPTPTSRPRMAYISIHRQR